MHELLIQLTLGISLFNKKLNLNFVMKTLIDFSKFVEIGCVLWKFVGGSNATDFFFKYIIFFYQTLLIMYLFLLLGSFFKIMKVFYAHVKTNWWCVLNVLLKKFYLSDDRFTPQCFIIIRINIRRIWGDVFKKEQKILCKMEDNWLISTDFFFFLFSESKHCENTNVLVKFTLSY